MKAFRTRLDAAVARADSLLCVGLDPDLESFPDHLKSLDPGRAIIEFNRQIIEATSDLVSAYKPNFGFYLAYGVPGLETLAETRRMIPSHIPVILDCKIGDFATTSDRYARGLLDLWDFDAVTIAPYMGEDGLAPLMARDDRAVFVLCKTSNPGSGEFQDLTVDSEDRLFERVAVRTRIWDEGNPATVGLVVGATWPEHLRRVRELCPDQPILLPGIGAQQGDLQGALKAGLDARGLGLIPTASRSILYAGRGVDFVDAVRQAAESTAAALRAARSALMPASVRG